MKLIWVKSHCLKYAPDEPFGETWELEVTQGANKPNIPIITVAHYYDNPKLEKYWQVGDESPFSFIFQHENKNFASLEKCKEYVEKKLYKFFKSFITKMKSPV